MGSSSVRGTDWHCLQCGLPLPAQFEWVFVFGGNVWELLVQSVLFIMSTWMPAEWQPPHRLSLSFGNSSENLVFCTRHAGAWPSRAVAKILLSKVRENGDQVVVRALWWGMTDPAVSLNLQLLGKAAWEHFPTWGRLSEWFWRTKIINVPFSPYTSPAVKDVLSLVSRVVVLPPPPQNQYVPF